MSKIAGISGFLFFGTLAGLAAQNVTVSGRVEISKTAGRGRESDQGGVVVWLTPVGASQSGQPAANAVRRHVSLLQKNKSFHPHILVATEGADVEFPNADPFFHNVFSLFEGKRFDLGLYEAGSTRTVRFDRPGISYIFCNIHPEMSATILILKNTAHYGVSDHTGRITIVDVPEGNYALEVWEEGESPESLKNIQREIGVSNASASLGVIRLSRNSGLHVAHKNKYGRDYEDPTPANPAYKRP